MDVTVPHSEAAIEPTTVSAGGTAQVPVSDGDTARASVSAGGTAQEDVALTPRPRAGRLVEVREGWMDDELWELFQKHDEQAVEVEKWEEENKELMAKYDWFAKYGDTLSPSREAKHEVGCRQELVCHTEKEMHQLGHAISTTTVMDEAPSINTPSVGEVASGGGEVACLSAEDDEEELLRATEEEINIQVPETDEEIAAVLAFGSDEEEMREESEEKDEAIENESDKEGPKTPEESESGGAYEGDGYVSLLRIIDRPRLPTPPYVDDDINLAGPPGFLDVVVREEEEDVGQDEEMEANRPAEGPGLAAMELPRRGQINQNELYRVNRRLQRGKLRTRRRRQSRARQRLRALGARPEDLYYHYEWPAPGVWRRRRAH